MSAQPLVSIVMPTYNRLRFLPATVASIFSQTLRGWELIVADDGSDAPARDYLATLERDERVRVLRLDQSGNPGKRRNDALAFARAPLVAFMDSDDLWAPQKLERQLAALRAQPGCGWCYTAFVVVDAEDTPLPSERHRAWTPYRGDIFDEVVRGAVSIRTPAVVVSADLLRDVGAFDEAIDCAEDYDLWARLALRSPICVVDEPLVRVRRHRSIDVNRIGHAHAARDYSLRKLARQVQGSQRALVNEERSRNALLQAGMIAAHGKPQRALAVIFRSLSIGWRYPGWWYGAAKAVGRVALATRVPNKLRSNGTASKSVDPIKARLRRRGEETRTGDR